MRLIDADAVITRLHENSKQVFGTDDIPKCSAMSIVKDEIDAALTVDAVPVVRCRDCIKADKYGHCEMQNFWGTQNDYCSRGKRREDGADND